MSGSRRTLLLVVIVTSMCGLCGAEDWPQFRGPGRDGKSSETGLLKRWPAGGPKLLWSVGEVGVGFSSAAVAEGLVYTTGMFGGEGYLFAFDLQGDFKWKVSYGPEWTRSHPGTRTTPTVDEGRVYVLSGTGGMFCFDARGGERIWQVNILEDFEGKAPRWGLTGSPLIDGRKLICTPGGKKGTMVALDKTTGRTIWATTGLDELSAYCSPILVKRGPNRLVINMVEKSVIAVSPDSGRLIWRIPFATSYDTGTVTPVYHDGALYVTSVVQGRFTKGGALFELSEDGTTVVEKWSDQTLDCHHGGVILLDGFLYGSNWKGNNNGDWVCLDWATGKVIYEQKWNGNKGPIIYADGMFYCYDENTGEVGLVRASSEGFKTVSSFRVTLGSGSHWAHPAISDGRLYIRHGEAMMAYDIRGEQ